MDFQLDSEQRMIQELTRQMVDRKIVPIMKAHDADKPLPKDAMLQIFKICAEQGLTSARVPEEVGGAGSIRAESGLDARAIAAGNCVGADRPRRNRRETLSIEYAGAAASDSCPTSLRPTRSPVPAIPSPTSAPIHGASKLARSKKRTSSSSPAARCGSPMPASATDQRHLRHGKRRQGPEQGDARGRRARSFAVRGAVKSP